MRVFEYLVVEVKKNPDAIQLLTRTAQLAVAENSETVKKRAIKDTPLPEGVNIDDVDVLVRPFV